MPCSAEKLKVAGTQLDLRVKLTASQKDAIKSLSQLGYSIRELAEMFSVSTWSVQTLLKPPAKRSEPKKYPTEYWTEAKRRHKKRKQELKQSGEMELLQKRKRQ